MAKFGTPSCLKVSSSLLNPRYDAILMPFLTELFGGNGRSESQGSHARPERSCMNVHTFIMCV